MAQIKYNKLLFSNTSYLTCPWYAVRNFLFFLLISEENKRKQHSLGLIFNNSFFGQTATPTRQKLSVWFPGWMLLLLTGMKTKLSLSALCKRHLAVIRVLGMRIASWKKSIQGTPGSVLKILSQKTLIFNSCKGIKGILVNIGACWTMPNSSKKVLLGACI